MERKNPVYLRVSDAALQEAADIEGFVPYAYDDKDPKSLANKTFITPDLADAVEGTLTIGYGHTRGVKPGDRVTKEEALRLLRSDARDAESCVHRHVNVPLTQGEFDGLWDLFFNVGPGRMKGTNGPNDPGKDGIACLGKSNGRPSTLLGLLNARQDDDGNYARAAECFTQWRNKGSVWEWGLTKRRIRFMLIFMNLPITRAMNALPNAMPPTDQARHALVQHCIAVAREEAVDMAGLAPPEPPPAPPPEPVAVEPPPPPPPEPPAVVEPVAPKPPPVAAEPELPHIIIEPEPEPEPAQAPPDPPAAPPAKPDAAPQHQPKPEPETKHPAQSTTIWGVVIMAMAPQLEQIGNQLLQSSTVGGAIGKILMTLGVIFVVMGRVSATKALSTSAPIRKPTK